LGVWLPSPVGGCGSRHNIINHFIIANKINKLLTKSLLYEIKNYRFYEFYWALAESMERNMLIRSGIFSIWSYPVQGIIQY
jgi:hypothetical protein